MPLRPAKCRQAVGVLPPRRRPLLPAHSTGLSTYLCFDHLLRYGRPTHRRNPRRPPGDGDGRAGQKASHLHLLPIDRKDGAERFNSAVLVDRHGRVAAVYNKAFPRLPQFKVEPSPTGRRTSSQPCARGSLQVQLDGYCSKRERAASSTERHKVSDKCCRGASRSQRSGGAERSTFVF